MSIENIDAGAGRKVPDDEAEAGPRTLAECLEIDPTGLGDGLHQFVQDFEDALAAAVAGPIMAMVAKLVRAVEVEAEQFRGERQRDLVAALAERFPMIGPALRCLAAHLETTDLGDTLWNCPGGACRTRTLEEWRARTRELLADAPSFDLLSALGRTSAGRSEPPDSVRRLMAEHDGLMVEREAADARDEALEGRLWSNEYETIFELLAAHLPGLEPALRVVWGHARDEGYTVARRGEWCCAPSA